MKHALLAALFLTGCAAGPGVIVSTSGSGDRATPAVDRHDRASAYPGRETQLVCISTNAGYAHTCPGPDRKPHPGRKARPQSGRPLDASR